VVIALGAVTYLALMGAKTEAISYTNEGMVHHSEDGAIMDNPMMSMPDDHGDHLVLDNDRERQEVLEREREAQALREKVLKQLNHMNNSSRRMTRELGRINGARTPAEIVERAKRLKALGIADSNKRATLLVD